MQKSEVCSETRCLIVSYPVILPPSTSCHPCHPCHFCHSSFIYLVTYLIISTAPLPTPCSAFPLFMTQESLHLFHHVTPCYLDYVSLPTPFLFLCLPSSLPVPP